MCSGVQSNLSMENLSPTMRRELFMRLPAALHLHVSCFAFSDEHPAEDRPFDVVVCTSKGEVIELYRRQVNASTRLGDGLVPRDVTIYRNRTNLKYYLVSTFDSLHIISAKGNLNIRKNIENVDHFVIDDPACEGTAHVRLWYNDDAVPVVLDENFESAGDSIVASGDVENGSAFASSLRSKLAEARHTVAVNERRHEELLRFRQAVTHTLLQDVCPNPPNSVFRSCPKVHEAMSCLGPGLWLKMCNGRVVLGATICNNTDNETFTDIKLTIQSDTGAPLIYATQIYSAESSPPFWQKKSSKELLPKSMASIVAETDIPIFSSNSQVKYKGLIIYKMKGSDKFLPLEAKCLTSLDTLNESFDLLSSNEFDSSDFLAIMASTKSLKLRVLMVQALSTDQAPPDLISILIQHMKMEALGSTDNVLIHKTSPHHVLHGLMILVKESQHVDLGKCYNITVFSRDKSQISALLHLMYDGIPYRLVVTSPEIAITEKNTQLKALPTKPALDEHFMDVDILTSPQDRQNDWSEEMSDSLSAQMETVLQYLDGCMVSMASSKNGELVNLIGTKIDFFGSGQRLYEEFVCKLNKEIRKGCLVHGRNVIGVNWRLFMWTCITR